MALLVVVGLTGPASAWARKKKPRKQAPPADLPGHIEYLARQLYGLHLDESETLAGQIQKLVTDHMQDRKSTRLNSSHIQKSRMPSSA